MQLGDQIVDPLFVRQAREHHPSPRAVMPSHWPRQVRGCYAGLGRLTMESLMRVSKNFAFARLHGRRIVVSVLCGLALAACAHHMRPMFNDRTAVISGKRTVGDSTGEATQKLLIQAARLTLDHGFRYFRIANSQNVPGGGDALSIRPGADVTIEVYREGEIDPRSRGVWDAQNIGAGRMPDGVR